MLILMWCGVCAGTVSEDVLLKRAGEQRDTARANLAEVRQQILEQRREMADRINAAYERLDAARDKAAAAQRERADLEKMLTVEQQRAAENRETVRKMREYVNSELEMTLGEDAEAEVIEERAAEWLRLQLADYQGDMAITVETGAVIGRDGREYVTPILRLGAFAAYACGDEEKVCGLLVKEKKAQRVAGPHLSLERQTLLQAAAAGQAGMLPVDVKGNLGRRNPGPREDVLSRLEAGGVFIYPIFAAGVMGVLLILERVVYLLRNREPMGLVREVFGLLEAGQSETARETLCGKNTPMTRVLGTVLRNGGANKEEKEAAIEAALLEEAPAYERSLAMLATLAAIAPLLGLLGTVSGMIKTFNMISLIGSSNPKLLSGGISEALLTTQMGLLIAIPLLLGHTWLRRWVQRREGQLEHLAIRALSLREGGKRDA